MKPFGPDHIFEEAARSADSCDRLLKRFKRERKLGLISILLLAFVALAFCIAVLIPLEHWLRSPTFPMPPSLNWRVSSFTPSLIYAVLGSLFVTLAVQFAFMLHNDLCIKMLLFMREHQTRLDTTNDNTRNA